MLSVVLGSRRRDGWARGGGRGQGRTAREDLLSVHLGVRVGLTARGKVSEGGPEEACGLHSASLSIL